MASRSLPGRSRCHHLTQHSARDHRRGSSEAQHPARCDRPLENGRDRATQSLPPLHPIAPSAGVLLCRARVPALPLLRDNFRQQHRAVDGPRDAFASERFDVAGRITEQHDGRIRDGVRPPWHRSDRAEVEQILLSGLVQSKRTQAIMQTCGVTMLDEEAQEAFKRASPFPNPPKDLVAGNGEIQFNFGFIFELSGRSNVKFFKYQ